MKILIILLFTISTAFAQNVRQIKAGEAAPSDGFFVTKEQLQKFVDTDQDRELLRLKVIKLEELQVVQDERINLYRSRITEIDKELTRSTRRGSFKGIGGFVLGVLATSAAAYAAIQVSR